MKRTYQLFYILIFVYFQAVMFFVCMVIVGGMQDIGAIALIVGGKF
ncbi:hypothetical protein [Shewanella sp. OMA3-2]|nr:hypothetical protein [Shewanella sp. OMA3-2]UJF21864.1 hypothetical protein L0B17_17855 [Shewanella sp. OMA3-2]